MASDTPDYLMANRCWAEIDLDALRHNVAFAKSLAGEAGNLMGVVKADAYGHGMENVAPALDPHLEFFGVANVAEAVELDALGVESRIFILGAALEHEREVIVGRDFVPAISSFDEALAFDRLAESHGKSLPVHLVIDTGMGRIGFQRGDLDEITSRWRDWKNLVVEGVASHLPSADEDPEFTRTQIDLFDEIVRQLRDAGIDFRHVHLANSAGLLGFEHQPCTLFRPGLMLYGIAPLPEWQEKLKTVLVWKTRVTLVRDLPPGSGVSYGRTFFTSREPFTRVATLGVGYGDGYPRSLKDVEVIVHGRRCPVIGRVTMDQIMVDVSELGDAVSVGDVAELMGANVTAAELARKAGTIPWEIFTGITQRVARVIA